jgi:hypothetical protein
MMMLLLSFEDGDSIIYEKLVSTYQYTRRYNPEEQHRHPHRRENLKYQNILIVITVFL